MKRIFQLIKKAFNHRYIYSLQKFPPIKKDGIYILKEVGSHTCIKASAEDILQTEFIYNIDPYDLIYIMRFEEKELKEKQKFLITEEKRDASFIIQNGYSRRHIDGKELLTDHHIVKKIDPQILVKIAYMTGLKDGRKISEQIKKSEQVGTAKGQNLKVIK